MNLKDLPQLRQRPNAPDRLRAEQAFHDEQARQRHHHFRRHPEALRFATDAYLDHETWIRPALQWLGDVRGRRVLDCGCGHAMAAVVLARRGAQVTALDLSGGYVREARARAGANGVALQLVQANGEALPFADGAFEAVWGNAILHHLDLAKAGREIFRVLAPGGRAVFCEPWGENPILGWARRRLGYPGKERTAHEAPLRQTQLGQLYAMFPKVEVTGHQLLAMLGKIWRRGPWQRRWARWDAALLHCFPRMVKWCRYVVVRLEK